MSQGTRQGRGVRVDFPQGAETQPHPEGEVRPQVTVAWKQNSVPGLDHGPTFQGRGDAAHLVEACVPLTADHLWRRRERAGGQSPRLGGSPRRVEQGRGKGRSVPSEGQQYPTGSTDKREDCKCLAHWAPLEEDAQDELLQCLAQRPRLPGSLQVETHRGRRASNFGAGAACRARAG